jgi:uncharacterized protein (TIGR02231 family)
VTSQPESFIAASTARLPYVIGLVIIASILAPRPTLAARMDARSKITSVTVYANRAMIERTARLRLEPGRQRVSFAGLPSTADERSFRVSGRASFPLTILGSEIKRIAHVEAIDERVKSVLEKIDAAEARKSELQARLGVIATQRAFVESIKSSAGDRLSEELALGRMDTESWRGAYDFLGSSLEDLAVRRLALDAEMKDLEAELNVLNRELRMIKRSGADVSIDAVAEVEAQSPGGEAEIVLTYMVTGASWSPSYDARLLPGERLVEMTAYGVVTQKTGEDWTDVKLALSTAHPATGAEPPHLEPWSLDLYPSYEAEKAAAQPRALSVVADENVEMTEEMPDAAVGGAVGLQAGLIAMATHVDRAGVTATYDIAARGNVPADGTPIKTAIGSASFEPELKHASTPVAAEKAYLSSEMKNDSEYALLPGQVDVFVGPDMVGVQRIDATTVPGESFRLFFGADPEVKIKRETIKEERSKPGKRMTLRRELRTTITNLKADPIEIAVKDRLPVSRSKEIKVDVEKTEPDPDSVGADGIAVWTIRLAPGEEAFITLKYEIAYPGGANVMGL